MDPTLATALRTAEAALAALGSPRSDAAELLSRLLGVGRGDLVARAGDGLTPGQAAAYAAWVARRAAGEPVQYITGRAAFRDLDLAVDRRVLVPRPETEELVGHVLAVLAAERERWPQPRVLDLGTGSGCIALAVAAEWPAAQVTAADASPGALAVAAANAAALGLAGRVRFLAGDWYAALPSDERFEVVVSNPPYIAASEADLLAPEVRDWEPHAALFAGEDGVGDLRTLIADAPRHLVAGGLLALELSEFRAAEVAAWLEGAHDWAEVALHDDLAGRPRVLLARRERGPAIAPAQWGEDRA
jgi:release factor glutamine methyltransferase